MSVNALKSLVTASGGLARPNKFAIELPNIPGIDLTNRDLNLLCRTVSMPSKQISTIEKELVCKLKRLDMDMLLMMLVFPF